MEPIRRQEEVKEVIPEAVPDNSTPIDDKERHSQSEQERLDIFEHEQGKYIEKYFGFSELIAEDWNMRMNAGKIDKYIKETLQEKDYDFTTSTYRHLIAEMEDQINSRLLTPQKRLQRLAGYIETLKKLKQIQKQKLSFLE